MAQAYPFDLPGTIMGWKQVLLSKRIFSGGQENGVQRRSDSKQAIRRFSRPFQRRISLDWF